jgi:hypothetical protein
MAERLYAHAVENAIFGMSVPFQKQFKGVSHCSGCGKWSAFPELSFCQGSFHQARRSRCAESYVLDRDGNPSDRFVCASKEFQRESRTVLSVIKTQCLGVVEGSAQSL